MGFSYFKRILGMRGENSLRGIPLLQFVLPGVILLVFFFSFAGGEESASVAWWEEEGVRILVARSNTLYRQHPPTREQIREIKEAGFNVYGARWNRLEYEEVTNTLRMCAAEGIHYAPWIRGSLANEDDDEKKLVWENGAVQSLYGPLAPELWDYLKERTAFYAGLSVEWPLVGLMLDFEAYADNKQDNLYYLSYDVYSLRLYSEYAGVAGPPAGLKPTEAVEWVRSRPESDWAGYEGWFRGRFRENARKVREIADGHNPRFLFMVYAGPGLTSEIAAVEWNTEKAPFVYLAVDYGRPSPLLSEHLNLKTIEERTRRRMEQWKARHDVDALVLGGPLPGYRGSDPEFSAKKAAVLARDGDGYWVWYAMNFTPEEHREYFRWYRKANDDIRSGSFSIADMPRQNPEPKSELAVRRASDFQVGHLGDMRNALHNYLEAVPGFEPHRLDERAGVDYTQFDMIILQALQAPDAAIEAYKNMLRDYVHEGGSLVLAYTTISNLGSPFPMLAEGRHSAEAVRQTGSPHPSRDDIVIQRGRRVVADDASLSEGMTSNAYQAHYMYHVPIKPGPHGTVVTENPFGMPVTVIGHYGAGRVAVIGDHLARRQSPVGDEARLFENIFRFLTRQVH